MFGFGRVARVTDSVPAKALTSACDVRESVSFDTAHDTLRLITDDFYFSDTEALQLPWQQ